MKVNMLLPAAIVILLMAGCYDARQDKEGRTIRVNRITGEVYAVEGDKIVKLKTEKEAAADPAASKEWAAIPILNHYAKVSLKTKWDNGSIFYQIDVDRNLREMAGYNAFLTIELYDGESFLLRKFSVTPASMVMAVNPDGSTGNEMQYKGTMQMNRDLYEKIQKWDVIWSGFNKP